MVDQSEADSAIVDAISEELGDRLRDLIEGKHVYQRIRVDVEGILAKSVGDRGKGKLVDAWLKALEQEPLPASQSKIYYPNGREHQLVLVLLLRTVKIHCSTCGSRETFVPVHSVEAINECQKGGPFRQQFELANSMPLRIYFLTYQCARCKGPPTSFLIRREGWKLHLDGRSPMEEVELPAFIPKPEARLYRDALIASHGGKTLAAIFYLRTFIEMFARRIARISERIVAEELFIPYSQTIPQKYRDTMPSLKDWYGQLSEAIHEAREDESLFVEALEEITRHFDMRRLFKLTEP